MTCWPKVESEDSAKEEMRNEIETTEIERELNGMASTFVNPVDQYNRTAQSMQSDTYASCRYKIGYSMR